MINKLLYTLLLITFLIAFTSNKLINKNTYIHPKLDNITYSVNPPIFHTGAPGENDCTECHTGNVMPPNNIINLSFSGGNNYELNQTYTIELSVDSSNIKNGFELTILDIYGLGVGTFIAGNNSSVTTALGKEYISHNSSLNQHTFTFQWTSPSIDRGNLFIYYCFNISNNSNTPAGDKIYKSQNIIYGPTSGLTNNAKENFTCYYNQQTNQLFLKYNTTFSVMFYDINGKNITKDILFDSDSYSEKTFNIPSEYKNKVLLLSIDSEIKFTKKILIY